MAFQHNLDKTDNNFSTDFTGVYTLVSTVEIVPEPVYKAPAEGGGEPTLVSKHTIKFKTMTFVDKDARDTNKGHIAEQSYQEPYVIPSSQDNVIAFCYAWLSANVAMFADATDV